jgi:hypothetical protein
MIMTMKISTLFPEAAPPNPITVTAPRWDVKRSIYRLLATITLAIIINIIVFIPTYAQLQQSGGAGSSVTITGSLPAGSNVIGHVIVDTTSTTAVTQATGTNLHTVVDSGTITTLTGITNALPAGANSIGTVRTEPLTSCGATIVDSGITVIPATTTAITGMGAAATCMDKIYLNNTLGTSAICNVTDVTGPTSYVTSFSIPGNSNLLLLFGGIKFAGGVKWFCPTGTVDGQALAYQ